jgi:glutamate/tyrosine decarboxylase-like PLP-dependent enzyme
LADRARAEDRLELLAEPELSIVCFRYVPEGGGSAARLDELNNRVLQVLRRDTPYVPSSTRVGGRFALRPCYVNPRTTEADVDGLADAVLEIGAALSAQDG